jgi:hypothetical protein
MSDSLQQRVRQLGDLELALLLSCVAEEHCIFTTEPHNTSGLAKALLHSCTRTFNVRAAFVQCSHDTTIDDFNEAILVDVHEETSSYPAQTGDSGRQRSVHDRVAADRFREPGRFGSVGDSLEKRQIADVIVVNHLDLAPEMVQVQALELIRSKRIFTRSSMQVAPKGLLVVAILSNSRARLIHHLQDLFCMSQFHAEDEKSRQFDGSLSQHDAPLFERADVDILRKEVNDIEIIAEIAQYIHNVEVFLRNSRFVKSGVTAAATRHLRKLSRALAPLHGLDFIPPSLVALAARKVYTHRLVLATSANERSLLWGSDPEAVEEMLHGITVEDVIEEVLVNVEAPL